MKQVEDWNITVESFAFFPTVPLLFDEESWKALWLIINKKPLEVRGYAETATRTKTE